MIEPAKRALKDALTDLDGESYAVIKILGMALVVVFLGLVIASFVTGKPFDMMAYGTGAGLVIGAMGAAIKLTDAPKPTSTNESKES